MTRISYHCMRESLGVSRSAENKLRKVLRVHEREVATASTIQTISCLLCGHPGFESMSRYPDSRGAIRRDLHNSSSWRVLFREGAPLSPLAVGALCFHGGAVRRREALGPDEAPQLVQQGRLGLPLARRGVSPAVRIQRRRGRDGRVVSLRNV